MQALHTKSKNRHIRRRGGLGGPGRRGRAPRARIYDTAGQHRPRGGAGRGARGGGEGRGVLWPRRDPALFALGRRGAAPGRGAGRAGRGAAAGPRGAEPSLARFRGRRVAGRRRGAAGRGAWVSGFKNVGIYSSWDIVALRSIETGDIEDKPWTADRHDRRTRDDRGRHFLLIL